MEKDLAEGGSSDGAGGGGEGMSGGGDGSGGDDSVGDRDSLGRGGHAEAAVARLMLVVAMAPELAADILSTPHYQQSYPNFPEESPKLLC